MQCATASSLGLVWRNFLQFRTGNFAQRILSLFPTVAIPTTTMSQINRSLPNRLCKIFVFIKKLKMESLLNRLLSKHFSLHPFSSKDWVSLMFAPSVGHQGETFWNLGPGSLENAFLRHFLTSKHTLFIADKLHFSPWISWFGDKLNKILSPKAVHKSR